MKATLPISLLCGLMLSLVGLPGRTSSELAVAQDQPQEESISVETADGRTLTGHLDAQTDAEQLWLRTSRDSAVLLRPIPWDRIARVHLLDRDLSGEQLREIVETIKPRTPAANGTAAGPREIVIQGPPRRSVASASPDEMVPVAPRVRSLAIEASVANWDGDVEVDGLLVRVFPLDGGGAMVPVRGTLRFDLTGQHETVARGRRPPTTLGRWTQPVAVEDFAIRGAVYRLPFQGVHPEFDLTVAPHGMLHARLSVPGQGTFETTESMLRIRPYSSVRDRLQLSTGHRFLPQERIGHGAR